MVRADLFNAFNHVIYGFPNNDIASTTTPAATFGRLNSTANQYSPRSIQIVLRYTF